MTIPTDPLNSSHILDQYVERNYKDINCPAVIISQQRSHWQLLSQLMDGHEELYVHPSELHIGRPNKYYWPNLNLWTTKNSYLNHYGNIRHFDTPSMDIKSHR